MIAINLIPASRIVRQQERRRIRQWCRGLLVFLCAVAAPVLVAQATSRARDVRMQSELATLSSEVTRREQALAAIRPKVALAQSTLAANTAIGEQPDWARLMVLLSEAMSDEMLLESVELEPVAEQAASEGNSRSRQRSRREESRPDNPRMAHRGAYQLRIRGYGRTLSEVQSFILRLEATGVFDQVSLGATRPETLRETQLIAFDARCMLGRVQP